MSRRKPNPKRGALSGRGKRAGKRASKGRRKKPERTIDIAVVPAAQWKAVIDVVGMLSREIQRSNVVVQRVPVSQYRAMVEKADAEYRRQVQAQLEDDGDFEDPEGPDDDEGDDHDEGAREFLRSSRDDDDDDDLVDEDPDDYDPEDDEE